MSFSHLKQLPSLEVAVSVPTPLLSEAQRLASNLLMVTMETAFSVPEAWTLTTSPGPPPCSYTAALQLPVTAEVMRSSARFHSKWLTYSELLILIITQS